MLHANIVVCVHWFSTPVCSVSNARPPLCAFARREFPAVAVVVMFVYIAVMVRCYGPFRVAKRPVLHGAGACFALPNGLFRAVACLGFATIWPLGSSLNWASRNQLFTQCLLGLACDGFLFRKYSPLFETTCRYNDFICIFAKDMLRPCILKRARITHVFIIFAKSGRQNRGCAILQGSDCMLTVSRRAHTLETIG